MTDSNGQLQPNDRKPHSNTGCNRLSWGCTGFICVLLALMTAPQFIDIDLDPTPRHKLRRVHADFRNMETAIGAYTFDWGSPPMWPMEDDADAGSEHWAFSSGAPEDGLYLLTTPAAYLSNLPYDVFRSDSDREASASYKYFCNGERWITWSVGPDGDSDLTPAILARLYDKEHRAFSREMLWHEYDPTNGASSNGDISRVRIKDGLVIWNEDGTP